MGIIHYWSNYVKRCRDYIKTDRYIVSFNVKGLSDNEFNKYFFFENRLDAIKFIKYVALPSFVYNKINIYKNDDNIIVEDYKDVLNFFMCNETNDNKEIIKRYSFFYNFLEEFEYEDGDKGEESFNEIIDRINEYFSYTINKISNVKVYTGIEQLLDNIINNNDKYFLDKIKDSFNINNQEELKAFLLSNKNDEDIINFIIDMVEDICNEVDLTLKK